MVGGRTACGQVAAKVALSYAEKDITCRRCFDVMVMVDLKEHDGLIQSSVKKANGAMMGRTVRLTVGRYKGRLGRIGGVTTDRDRLTYLVLVLRADGSGEILNTDGESRTYRPLSQFEVVL